MNTEKHKISKSIIYQYGKFQENLHKQNVIRICEEIIGNSTSLVISFKCNKKNAMHMNLTFFLL